ncbi:hypothetical protein HCJ66_00395 [Listeria sp. FSL L7-1582]|uniref:hypothetical protein n=1 Tax=Listeria portnoyi TaxID=2713504 RepID=UPI00164D159D|nr:hypothetical protein [Listeria portnoyi]MBC6307998.1 hypothetical protein [Listeria portnoyi]
MKTDKKELEDFSKIIELLIEKARNNDTEAICYTLNKLTLQDLEKVKTYFAGNGPRAVFFQLRTIIIGTFIAGMMIFYTNKYQDVVIVSLLSTLFLLVCIGELFRLFFAQKPIKNYLSIAANRSKYDRIVAMADIILNKQYEKDIAAVDAKFSEKNG